MNCLSAREAISARIDGEDPGLPASALDEHLASCADCRDWQQRAHELTRRARLGGPFLERDLTAQVLAAVLPVRPRPRRLGPWGRPRPAGRPGSRGASAAGDHRSAADPGPRPRRGSARRASNSGSFDLALAIAFAVGAIRPALSAGLAWPCGAAAAGLVVTAVADLIGGQTIGADEAQHLIAVAGAALLRWQARTIRSGAARPAWRRHGPGPPRPRWRAGSWPGDRLAAGNPAGAEGRRQRCRPGHSPDVAARDGGKVA